MTITDVWLRYMQVLRQKAPITAGAVRPPRPLSEREDAERDTAPWTAEIREFFSLHDGQVRPVGGEAFVGSVLPDFDLLCLDEVVARHRDSREHLHDTEDFSDEWVTIARQQSAGEIAYMFLRTYIPIAEHACGDLLFVDTRGGQRQGCVREFGAGGADEGDPESASLADYVDSVRISVESGIEHSSLVPTIEDGVLSWNVDFSDNPVQDPAPEPMMIRLPFALTYFQPSQIGPDDDLIDLDVVRQTVMDTAQSLHPASTVEGAESGFRRVPRQQGVSISWFVGIDRQTVTFVAVVMGIGNEVIVHEIPEDGNARFVFDE
ncbi:SMI1/KNR4 family protein [Rhodococcus sp. NPDC056743]|uniref:SMI1/KNR4 family protein n=1 Tax=Rhodococcus sp. NPDC056743 TaxID=3345934 RepID=UPI00366CB3EE